MFCCAKAQKPKLHQAGKPDDASTNQPGRTLTDVPTVILAPSPTLPDLLKPQKSRSDMITMEEFGKMEHIQAPGVASRANSVKPGYSAKFEDIRVRVPETSLHLGIREPKEDRKFTTPTRSMASKAAGDEPARVNYNQVLGDQYDPLNLSPSVKDGTAGRVTTQVDPEQPK